MTLHGLKSDWFEDGDLERLQRLREGFLGAAGSKSALADYWRERRDLEVYDAFFASRIGLKWDAVLAEVAERAPGIFETDTVVDWACGTGIATRRFLRHSPARRVVLTDRSQRAMDFAAERVLAEHPGVQVECRSVAEVKPDDSALLLVSHLMNELPERDLDFRFEAVARWSQLLWVESGTKPTSRQLSQFRDSITATHRILAPCPHEDACSALRAGDRDWCHFFAEPDPTSFTDGDVVRLARTLGIDLRSLPYAFVCASKSLEPTPPPRSRMLGRPQVKPKQAVAWACDAEGLFQKRCRKVDEPELFRRLKKTPETVRDLGPRE